MLWLNRDGLFHRFSESLRWPSRDESIVTVCLGWGTYEIMLGGARPSVLAFVTSILTMVIAVKADRIRRENSAANGKPEAA